MTALLIFEIIVAITIIVLIAIIIVRERISKGLKPLKPGHRSGLRTTDNRIIIKIGDIGKGTSTVTTEPMPKDCKCAGCRQYRQWLEKVRKK